jgi:hypothetical protein
MQHGTGDECWGIQHITISTGSTEHNSFKLIKIILLYELLKFRYNLINNFNQKDSILKSIFYVKEGTTKVSLN